MIDEGFDAATMRRGPELFSEHMSPAARRRRIGVLVVLLVASAALIWPVYDVFGGLYPLIFGLPLSLAWVVLWLFVVFGAVLWLYLTDPQ